MQLHLIIKYIKKIIVLIVLLITLVIFNMVIPTVWANSSTVPTLYQSKSWFSSLAAQNKSDDLSETSEPLPAEIAFKTTASRQNDLIYISFKIEPKYYLYQEKIKVILNVAEKNQAPISYKVLNKPIFKILSPVLPKAILYYDETFTTPT